MIGEHMLLRGLRNRFVGRGVPPDWATQIAGACYPGGAKKEYRKTGFVFARSLISKVEAYGIGEKLLAMPLGKMQKALPFAMAIIFGKEQVEAWIDEAMPDREQSIDASTAKEYEQALAVFGFDSDPTAVQVQARFKELIQQNHPDRYAGASEDIRRQREEQAKKINWAMEVLRRRVGEVKSESTVKEKEEENSAVGGLIVPPPPTPRPPLGLSPTPDPVPPSTPNPWPRWVLGAGVLTALAIVVALALPRIFLSPSPEPPAPPLSPAEVTLTKAVASARGLLSKKRYQSAVEAVSSFLAEPPCQPEDIKDKDLWVEYLDVLGESRRREYRARQGTRTEQEKYEYWPVMHELGLAWHYLMKDALADGHSDLANEAFDQADMHYTDVLVAITPSSKQVDPPEWRSIVCGWAMENRGTIRSQLASASGDEQLKKEARELLEQSRLFYSQTLGTDSEEYRRVYGELAKLMSSGRRDK